MLDPTTQSLGCGQRTPNPLKTGDFQMKRFALLFPLILAACVPPTPSVALPEFVSTATAYIDPSYPTAQAAISVPNQDASGIQVRMDRAWRDGKNLNADVCFTLPDASDWSIWSA